MSRLIVLRVALVLVVAIFVGRLYQVQVADHESRRYSADVSVTTRRYIKNEEIK